MLLNQTLCRDVDGSEDMKCMVSVLTWQLHQFMYDIGQFKVTNFCFLHTINSSSTPPRALHNLLQLNEWFVRPLVRLNWQVEANNEARCRIFSVRSFQYFVVFFKFFFK